MAGNLRVAAAEDGADAVLPAAGAQTQCRCATCSCSSLLHREQQLPVEPRGVSAGQLSPRAGRAEPQRRCGGWGGGGGGRRAAYLVRAGAPLERHLPHVLAVVLRNAA